MTPTRSDIDKRLALVMRDEQGGDAEAALQPLQLDLHLVAQLGVEIGQRLVEQQNARLGRDGAGDRDALLLAAGELPRIARRRSRRAGRAPSASLDAPRRVSARDTLSAARPKATFSNTRQMRKQRIGLEDEADAALVRRQAGDVVAAPIRMRPWLGSIEPGDHAQDRGLAAAGRSEQRDELALARSSARRRARPRRRHSTCPSRSRRQRAHRPRRVRGPPTSISARPRAASAGVQTGIFLATMSGSTNQTFFRVSP